MTTEPRLPTNAAPVSDLLQQWEELFNRRDWPAVIGLFVERPLFKGMSVQEIGDAAGLKAYFDAVPSGLTATVDRRSITTASLVTGAAAAFARIAFDRGSESRVVHLAVTVLEQPDGAWRIASWHLSIDS